MDSKREITDFTNIKHLKKTKLLQEEEEDEELGDVSVPGLKIILTPKRNILTRIVWTLAITVSLSIFIYQVKDRFDTFFDQSKAYGMKIFESKDRLPVYPKITICSSHVNYLSKRGIDPNRFGISDHLEACPKYLCQHSNQTIKNIYKELKIPTDNIKLIGKDSEISDWIDISFRYSRFLSQLGPCITIIPSAKISVIQLSLFIEDTYKPDGIAGYNFSLYKTYIHEEYVPPTPEWLIKHNNLYSHEPLEANIDTSQFINLNRTEKMCISSQIYEDCRQNCLDKFYKQSFCQLPYALSGGSSTKLPECNDQKLCFYATTQAAHIIENLDVRKCNCSRKCDWFLYNVQMSRGLSNKFQSINGLPVARMDVNFASYTRIEEFTAYNIVSLLSDVGGCLGLTIGLSILELLQLGVAINSWIQKLKNKVKKIKKNDNKEKVNLKPTSHNICTRVLNVFKPMKSSKYEVPEVSIPGVHILYGSHSNTKKIWWTLALVLSVILTSMQIHKHYQHLLYNSTAIDVTVGQNENAGKPFITLCPLVNVTDWQYHQQLSQWLEGYKREFNETVQHQCDFLRFPQINVDVITQKPSPNRLSKTTSKIHTVNMPTGSYYFPKIFGSCYGVELGIVFPQTPFFYDVNIALTNQYGWNFPGQPEKFIMYLSDNLNFMDFTVMQQAQPIPANAITYVTVQSSKFTRLNQTKRLCRGVAKTNHFRAVCLADYLHDHVPCELGSMGFRRPKCNTTENCRTGVKLSQQVLSEWEWNKCHPPTPPRCSQVVYKYSKYSIPHPYPPSRHHTEIRLHFQDIAIKHVSEYTSYTYISFFSDAGSIIGVTLGACLLTLLQLVDLGVYALRVIFCKNKIKKPVARVMVVRPGIQVAWNR